jgi:hypothetical protein
LWTLHLLEPFQKHYSEDAVVFFKFAYEPVRVLLRLRHAVRQGRGKTHRALLATARALLRSLVVSGEKPWKPVHEMSTSLLGRGIEGVYAEIGACYLAVRDRNRLLRDDQEEEDATAAAASGGGGGDDEGAWGDGDDGDGTTQDIFAWCEEALEACESKAMPPKVKGLRWELSSVRKVRDFLYTQVQQI